MQELLVENLGHTAFGLTKSKNQEVLEMGEKSNQTIQAKAGLKAIFILSTEYELINIYNKLLNRYPPLKSTTQLLLYNLSYSF